MQILISAILQHAFFLLGYNYKHTPVPIGVFCRTNDVNFDNVFTQCCMDQADEHWDRAAQFLKELTDTSDYYDGDATCLISRA